MIDGDASEDHEAIGRHRDTFYVDTLDMRVLAG